MSEQTFQCTICRRVQVTEIDNIRAFPNQCTITKGCKGILNPVIGTPYLPTDTSGLIDWYPRNKKPIVKIAEVKAEKVSMACSSNGALTAAAYLTDAQAESFTSLSIEFNQRLSSDISVIDYNYLIAVITTVISGRDSTGKILRFDQAAIDNNQVSVIANGVKVSNYSLTPNTVTFNNPLSVGFSVEVIVYSSPPSTKVYMQFSLNHLASFNANTSAWTNIRWASDSSSVLASERKWWIYTAVGYGNANPAGFLQLSQVFGVDSNGNATVLATGGSGFASIRFLLASPPYGNVDRYLQFYLDADLLATEFNMQTAISSSPTIHAEHKTLVEKYPPMLLLHDALISYSSYMAADENTADGSTLSIPILTGKKIIGPL